MDSYRKYHDIMRDLLRGTRNRCLPDSDAWYRWLCALVTFACGPGCFCERRGIAVH